MVSLGFDTLKGDPTGTFNLSVDTFREMGSLLADLRMPLLSVQEGGYNVRNIRSGAMAFFAGIANQRYPVKKSPSGA